VGSSDPCSRGEERLEIRFLESYIMYVIGEAVVRAAGISGG
jgi:hypothetical protein